MRPPWTGEATHFGTSRAGSNSGPTASFAGGTSPWPASCAAAGRQAGQPGAVTEDLTDDELERLQELTDAALPGPWKAFVEGRDHYSGDDFIRTGGLDDSGPDLYVTASYWDNEQPQPAGAADLDFIAAARRDVPRLVAEIRRLRKAAGL